MINWSHGVDLIPLTTPLSGCLSLKSVLGRSGEPNLASGMKMSPCSTFTRHAVIGYIPDLAEKEGQDGRCRDMGRYSQ